MRQVNLEAWVGVEPTLRRGLGFAVPPVTDPAPRQYVIYSQRRLSNALIKNTSVVSLKCYGCYHRLKREPMYTPVLVSKMISASTAAILYRLFVLCASGKWLPWLCCVETI